MLKHCVKCKESHNAMRCTLTVFTCKQTKARTLNMEDNTGKEQTGNISPRRKNWTSSTHIAHRDFTAHRCLLLSGHIGIPVANQTVILHTVVLMANQPVCVHFAFTLVGEGRTWGKVTLSKPSGWLIVKCDEKNLTNRVLSPKFHKIST